MNPRARKAFGCLVLLIYLAAYAVGAATLGNVLAPTLPAWGELVYYALAGVLWVAPLRPLFRWMNGRAT